MDHERKARATMRTSAWQRGRRVLFWMAAGAALAATAAEAADVTPSEAFQYRRLEVAVEADADPAASLDADAIVADWSGPGGARFRLPAFWDGGRTWRVRFAPPAPGRWAWYVAPAGAPDGTSQIAQGALDVRPAAGPNPLDLHGGILRVSGNRRFLTYADGTPFFWLGDTWWFCPSDLVPIDRSNRPDVPSMYRALVDTRAAQGYTVVHMAFLGDLAAGHGVSGNYSALFEGRIDPAYWQTVDRYLDYASAKGIVPVIGMGFHSGLDRPTLGQLQRLWRYVLARYGAQAVTFLISGEYNLASQVEKDGKRTFGEADARRVEKLLALGAFIKARDPYQRAMTIHPWYFLEEKGQARGQAWCDVVMLQGSHLKEGPPVSTYRDLYNRTSPKPLLEGECTYEGIGGFTDAVVRRNAYKAIQSGSFGFTYGAHGLWYPTQDEKDETFKEWGTPIPWWQALALPGGAQMKHLRACYERVAWWRLEPAPADRLENLPDRGARREAFVKADGDETILIYFAAAERPTPAPHLRLGGAGGTYAATWFDPRTGKADPLPDRLAPQGGRLHLPPLPDAQDWVLILRRADTP